MEKGRNEPVLKVIPCPRCGFQNPSNATYCQRCGAPLSLNIALLEDKMQKEAVKSAVDPEALAELVDALVEQKLKAKADSKRA